MSTKIPLITYAEGVGVDEHPDPASALENLVVAAAQEVFPSEYRG